MPDGDLMREAMALGEQQAQAVLAFREEELQHREQALTARAEATGGLAMTAEAAVVDDERVAAMGSRAAGVLIAEGDSWFDYPMNNVVRLLEDRYGYEVESVASNGDRVEDMAYSGGQLEKFTRLLEKLIRHGDPPRAILLSGGGNDIAGDEFAILLNHASSARAGLNENVVKGVIDERILLAYLHIVTAVTRVCEARLGQRIPILVHGYDYPVPDGRGFWGGGWVLPGPWLEPGFRAKRYEDMEARKAILRMLIDRFNEMLARVAAMPELSHVRYIDLRKTLSSGEDYREWWANELHPTKRGFLEVTRRFANAI
jgi:lysophospholipase L1-like esterase